jgi:hypothetical protein
MDGIERQPLTDRQLDREIESALQIEPSPEFLARVRTQVASEPELVVESGFSRMRELAGEPRWAVAILGIVLAIAAPQFMRRETSAPTTAAARTADVAVAPREAGGAQPVENRARQGAPAHSTSARARRETPVVTEKRETPNTLPLQLGQVLIAEDERRAFEFFVTAASQGRVPEKVVERGDNGARELAALSIEPLEIAPLPLLARSDRQGEGQW